MEVILFIIFAIIVGSGGDEGFGDFFKIIIIIPIIVFIIVCLKAILTTILNYFKGKNESDEERKERSGVKNILKLCSSTHLNPEINRKIVTLAESYIDSLSEDNQELSLLDYKIFYKLVQKEIQIKIPNDCYTEVPYCIREILYYTFLIKKKYNKKES